VCSQVDCAAVLIRFKRDVEIVSEDDARMSNVVWLTIYPLLTKNNMLFGSVKGCGKLCQRMMQKCKNIVWLTINSLLTKTNILFASVRGTYTGNSVISVLNFPLDVLLMCQLA